MEYSLIIPAAGVSSRMELGQKKEFLPLISSFFPNDKTSTVISCSAEPFLLLSSENPRYKLKSIVVLVLPQDENVKAKTKRAFFSDSVKKLCDEQKVCVYFIEGGSTRQKSVKNALEFLSQNKNLYQKNFFVAIHDAARPWVSKKIISECLENAEKHESAAPIINVIDTIKEIDAKTKTITNHLKRENLGAIQTPQVFVLYKILAAHRKAEDENFESTDDTEIWTKFLRKNVSFVTGSAQNKKITYKQDVTGFLPTQKNEEKMFRTGFGYDLHALVPGRRLMLGGVEIPSALGEAGHSDGDVLLHAISDAILGSVALGDIGEFFPPSYPKWKDVDSKFILSECYAIFKKTGWNIVNLDCVINLEKPKILPYRSAIIKSVTSILGIAENQVFVKAKTGEKLGDVGQQNAVATWVSVLVQK